MTSGSKGIHLYAALPPGQTSEQASAIAHELARAIEADHPDLVVSSMKKVERHGKVLIDWSQNNGAKTTIAPYSLRGRPQPTVAAPRTWDELDDPELRHLRFDEVLERVETIGDPHGGARLPRRRARGGRRTPRRPTSPSARARQARRSPCRSNPLGRDAAAGERPRFVIQEHHASRAALGLPARARRRAGELGGAAGRPALVRSGTTSPCRPRTTRWSTRPSRARSPRGEYGGGTVTIWDDGRYELEKWRDDEIIVTPRGGRAGRWAACGSR